MSGNLERRVSALEAKVKELVKAYNGHRHRLFFDVESGYPTYPVKRNYGGIKESFISKVIADGRVTLPKELRENHSIREGDFVEIQLIQKIRRVEVE